MTKRGNNISINCAVRHKKKIQQDFLPLTTQVFRTAVLNRLEGKEEGISRGER